MPDNTEQSWSDTLIALAEEALHDSGQHDTSMRLNTQLVDLSGTLRAWAGTIDPGVMRRKEDFERERLAREEADRLARDAKAGEEREARAARLETDENAFVDPINWESIEQARAGLRIAIRREHAKRTATRQNHLERVLALSDPEYERQPQETIELMQHREAAMRLGALDARMNEMLEWVEGNDDLEAAKTFDVMAGWE